MLPGKKYTPEDLIRILLRYWWVVAVSIVVCSVAGVVTALMLPNQYRSETLVLVVSQRVPEEFLRSTVGAKVGDRLRSIREQILSRSRLEQIINELSLYQEARTRLPMEIIVDRMRQKITTNLVREDAFTVSFVSDTPELAQKVTARLASLFSEENMRDREDQAERTTQFLQSQLEDARKRLAEHEERLEAYRRQYAGELPEQASTNLQAIQSAELQSQTLMQGLNNDRDRRLLLESQLADETAADTAPAAAPVVPSAQGQPLTTAQQLDAAEAALHEMEGRLTAEHPDVVRGRTAVQRLTRQLAEERAAAPARVAAVAAAPPSNPAEAARRSRLANLRTQLDALDRQITAKVAEEQRLRGLIATYRARLAVAPTREAELTALTRDDETLRLQYRSLLTKYEESTVAANLERKQIGDHFRILDPARVPQTAFSPNRRLISIGGAGAGVLVGFVLVALLEFKDRTIRSVADLGLLTTIPVLATLPSIRTSADERRVRRRWAVACAVGTGLGVAVVVGALTWRGFSVMSLLQLQGLPWSQ